MIFKHTQRAINKTSKKFKICKQKKKFGYVIMSNTNFLWKPFMIKLNTLTQKKKIL